MTTQPLLGLAAAPRRRAVLLAALLASLPALLVYLPTLSNGFVTWDDNLYVYRNRFVQRLDASLLREALFGFTAGNWHPLTWLSHAVDCALWGLNPLGHHLTNALLHAVNTSLVVVTVARLGRFPWWRSAESIAATARSEDARVLPAAALTGLIFGLHPLHVESVAWISERKDLLCASFFLLSLLAFAAYAAAPERREPAGPGFLGDRRYISALGLFALALSSKPMAVSLPLVLLVLDYCPFGRTRSRRTLVAAAFEKLPFFLLSLLSSVVTILAQSAGEGIVALRDIPPVERVIVAIRSLGFYLAKMLLPFGLAPFYPYPRETELGSAATWLSLAAIVAVSAAVILAARAGRPLWLAAWCWYGITLGPVLGLVQVGQQAMADRYAYLPSLGPTVAAVAPLAWLWAQGWLRCRRLAGVLTGAAAATGLLALASMTVRQTAIWKDGVTLWSAAIEGVAAHPSSSIGRGGTTLPASPRLPGASLDNEEAVAPDPTLGELYSYRAVAYQEAGRVSEALADYERAVRLDPTDKRYFVNRGLLLVRLGRTKAAAADFEAACRLGDDFGCKAAQYYRPRDASEPSH